MLIDTHTHVNDQAYADDYEKVIRDAKQTGVEKMLVVGFDRPTILRAMELVEKFEGLYAVIGWHPVDAVDCTSKDLKWIEALSMHEKVVAIGEIGLDYHWDKSPKEVQQKLLRTQIQLAKKVKLPIVIHNREATADVIQILQEENAQEIGGIMHCFGGSYETAKICMDMNFYISIGGPVTFKNAKKLQEVVKQIPLDKLLIETDCPYLAPHPYRGKRNEPKLVKLVAEKIAELKNCSYEEIAHMTSTNAVRILNLKD
ncbi:MAG TPA: TatD family hydrolase [Firmicutes bacterium]|nr:TatD family hydrolase [Bacillota bacterium]